jgi:hypothetical protein
MTMDSNIKDEEYEREINELASLRNRLDAVLRDVRSIQLDVMGIINRRRIDKHRLERSTEAGQLRDEVVPASPASVESGTYTSKPQPGCEPWCIGYYTSTGHCWKKGV